MKLIRNSSNLVVLAIILALLGSGCKSRKKQAELAAAEKAKMEQEARLKQQQADEEKSKAAAAEAKARQEAEAIAAEAARKAKSSTPAVKLAEYMDGIAGASSVASANSSITEALSLFESPETPVLIIISQEGGQKDYDKPTTIKAYLNYVKDQKKNINKIESVEFNSAGKINAVELLKKN